MVHILIVSETHPPSDGRVLHFARWLTQEDHTLHCLGITRSDRSPPPVETFPFKLTLVEPARPSMGRRIHLALCGLAARLSVRLGLAVYNRLPERKRLLNALQKSIADQRPRVVIAKHWSSLSLLHAINFPADRIIYDANELAGQEQSGQPLRHFLTSTLSAGAEARAIDGVARIISPSIAFGNEMTQRYQNRVRPTVVRNIPYRPRLPAATTDSGSQTRFLLVGTAAPDRRLQVVLRSVVSWPIDTRLVLLLAGRESEIQALKKLAKSLGVGDRVTFLDTVPPNDVVSTIAANGDFGLTFLPQNSTMKRLAEPNKIYQCLSAGLPLVGNELEGLAFLQDYNVGLFRGRFNEQDIASVVRQAHEIGPLSMRRNIRPALNDLATTGPSVIVDIVRKLITTGTNKQILGDDLVGAYARRNLFLRMQATRLRRSLPYRIGQAVSSVVYRPHKAINGVFRAMTSSGRKA